MKAIDKKCPVLHLALNGPPVYHQPWSLNVSADQALMAAISEPHPQALLRLEA